MNKRRIKVPALCLSVGLITTLGVAWTSAGIGLDQRTSQFRRVGLPIKRPRGELLAVARTLHRHDTRLATSLERFHSYVNVETPDVRVFESSNRRMAGWPPQPEDAWRELTPRWARACIEAPFPTREPVEYRLYGQKLTAHGWPWRALYVEAYWESGGTPPPMTSLRGGLPLASIPFVRRAAGLLPNATFPLLPIWTGFLANVAVFTTPWAILFIGVPFLRRTIRRRRGRCTLCGYSLHGLPPGSPCPECGVTVA